MASNHLRVLTQHYPQLRALKDIPNLLPYFVQSEIISINDEERIANISTSPEKVRTLLTHISGPLEADNTTPFYTMLKIMEEHGVEATRTLAGKIRVAGIVALYNTIVYVPANI